ncbi:MAG TPA: ribose-phosphate diphosphokinase [Burkholderiaceae bacterium]|nr:ribose-phosphate diphosphokinase [Burkholderiaceae bacterium]
MRLFALQATRDLGARVAAEAGCELALHEERDFEDGEQKLRPLLDVRGDDVYVVQGLHGDARTSPADKLVRLLLFAATLRDHGASRVTTVLPYLAYARKDRRTQPFDPVNSRYIAQLLEAVGVGRVVVLEVHNVAAFDNAFRIPALHLNSAAVLAPETASVVADGPVIVASPDPGGVKRAQLFREALVPLLGRDCGSAYIEKRRSGGVLSGSLLAGDVRDATVVLVDDLISTGGTLLRAARTCLDGGARRVVACVAHGLFARGADAVVLDPALSTILVTDSVAPETLSPPARARLRVVGIAPLLAATIKMLHEDHSR